MQMTGEYRILAPQNAVWAGLNDPEILRQAIPGCESVDKISDTEFAAKVTLAVGPVKARFTGTVRLTDLDPPNGYAISGEGQGGVAGFGKGGAKVRLRDDAGATVLVYEAEAQVGGKMAQLGARLIDATAKKLADEFFGRFAALMAAQAAVPVAEAPPAVPPPSPRLPPAIWIPATIVAVAILWWLVVGR